MPYPNYILDVNAAGGEDFISIVTAEATMQGEFTDSDPVTLDCRGGTEIISSTVGWGAGWTTPTGVNTVTVQAAAGHEHGGVIGGPSYVMKMDVGFNDLLNNTLPLSRFQGIQSWMTNVSSSTHFIQAGGLDVEYRDIIGRFTGTSNRSSEYFLDNPLKAINCVYLGATNAQSGMRVVGGAEVEGCTFVHAGVSSGTGINRGAGTPTIKNCVIAGFSTCFITGFNAASTNNASSDSSAPGSNPQTGVVVTSGVDFVDAANADLNPASGGKLEDTGTYSAESDPDIAGNARGNPNCEIGAWEIAGAPAYEFDGPDIVAQTGTDAVLFSFDEDGNGTVASRFSAAGTYALAAGSDALQTGLTVNAATGNIEGTPTEVAVRNIIIEGTET